MSRIQHVITVFSDAGHGWAKVSTRTLEKLDLAPDHFSNYSYRYGDFIYLEEDCDLTYFDKKYAEKMGHSPGYRSKYSERSRIRGYPSNVAGPAYQKRTGNEF